MKRTMQPLNYLLGIIAILAIFSCSQKTSSALFDTKSIKNIKIDEFEAGDKYGPSEPSIAINPVNPRNIVGASILNRVYTSDDGGYTWSKQRVTSPYGVFGDPVIEASATGCFYFAHLSDTTGVGWANDRILDRIVVQKSCDGGKTWNEGGYAGLHHPKDQDKQWIAFDPQNNHLHMTWTEFDKYADESESCHSRILYSYSENDGLVWSDPIVISKNLGNCIDDDDTVEGAVPTMDHDGNLYSAWSFDEKIWLNHSVNAGGSWMTEEKVVATQPGGWTFDIPGINRCNGLPVTKVDNSKGPHDGTIYINWTDQRNGANDTDVWIIKSSDQGQNWSSPIRVNDDKPGKQQFLSCLDIDPVTGYLYVLFCDRRNYNDNRTDMYLAVSKDGGNTFSNTKISTSPFVPTNDLFYGDYNDISVYNGTIRPIWTRIEDGKLSVWTAIIEMTK